MACVTVAVVGGGWRVARTGDAGLHVVNLESEIIAFDHVEGHIRTHVLDLALGLAPPAVGLEAQRPARLWRPIQTARLTACINADFGIQID